MMGRSHVTMGLCAVVAASSANWINWSSPNVATITAGLVLAGSVWPDIDHRSSNVTRSFGPITYVLCTVVRFLCRRIYVMTRLRNDPKGKDPHRTFTHTWPGALTAGALLVAISATDRIAATVALAGLFGVAARAWDKDWQLWAALGGGVLMWDLWPDLGQSVWILGAAFAAGCWLHVYTDCVTKAGAPMYWPFMTVKREAKVTPEGITKTRVVQRRRWHMTGPPHWLRFYAGDAVEPWVVRGTVVLTLLLCYWLVLT